MSDGAFPTGFPIPPLQAAPDVTVRPDGTWSDGSWPESAVALRVTRAEEVFVVDAFFNRFRSQCGAPVIDEQTEPVEPPREREAELGDGRCVAERLVEIRRLEKSYCDVTVRWERWVVDRDPAGTAGLEPIEVRPATETTAESAGMGRVVSVHAAAGAGALGTSTDLMFGDEAAVFLQADVSILQTLDGRKVAEGWTPVGFWYETREPEPPNRVWEAVGDPYPCPGIVPPPPGGDGEAVAVPGGEVHRRVPWIGLLGFGGLLLLLVLLFIFVFGGPDDGEIVAVPGDTTPAATATPTTEPAITTMSTTLECTVITPLGSPGTIQIVTADPAGLMAPEVAVEDGDAADGFQVAAGFVEGTTVYLVQYHFPEGPPDTSGHPAWVGGEVDPQLAAGGHVDGPDVVLNGIDHPEHLDLNPVTLPPPQTVLEQMGLEPTTPHSVVLLMDSAAFEGSNESSIWYNHTAGFHHFPQPVTGPPDPTPTFDPTVFGPVGGWFAQSIENGTIRLSDRPAEHLYVAALLVFAPQVLPGGCN